MYIIYKEPGSNIFCTKCSSVTVLGLAQTCTPGITSKQSNYNPLRSNTCVDTNKRMVIHVRRRLEKLYPHLLLTSLNARMNVCINMLNMLLFTGKYHREAPMYIMHAYTILIPTLTWMAGPMLRQHILMCAVHVCMYIGIGFFVALFLVLGFQVALTIC